MNAIMQVLSAKTHYLTSDRNFPSLYEIELFVIRDIQMHKNGRVRFLSKKGTYFASLSPKLDY